MVQIARGTFSTCKLVNAGRDSKMRRRILLLVFSHDALTRRTPLKTLDVVTSEGFSRAF